MKYFLLSISFVLVVVLSGCSFIEETLPAATKNTTVTEEQPTNTLWGLKMRFMDSSRTKAVLQGNVAKVYAGSKQVTTIDTNVVCDFYDETGTVIVAQLTADSALVDNRTNNMWSKGNVVVVSQASQTRVETSVMYWDNSRRKLHSNQYVKITRPGEFIEGGVGFESDERLKNYKIFNVTGMKTQ